MSEITEHGPELTTEELEVIEARKRTQSIFNAMHAKPISLRPFRDNDRVRVLVNGQGCYCRVKDICSRDILTVLNYLNAERKMGRSVIGFGTNIHGNSIQIDKVS